MTMNMNENVSRRRAKETRAAARVSLKPHYWLAVLACLIAAILGAAVAASSSTVDFTFNEDETAIVPEDLIAQYGSWEQFGAEVAAILDLIPWGFVLIVVALALVTSVAYTWVGYCVRIGLCRFHLTLTDGEKPSISMLFSYFGRAFWRAVGMNILRDLILFAFQLPALIVFGTGFGMMGYGFLSILSSTEGLSAVENAEMLTVFGQGATLLLIAMLLLFLTLPIALRYVMANYVLAENPEVGALGALRESRRMMKGNKWRYICLQLSFIGWHILAAMALGIGGIFLAPYVEQSITEFYHEVSGRAAIRSSAEALGELMEGL